jgi:hypothetical protein
VELILQPPGCNTSVSARSPFIAGTGLVDVKPDGEPRTVLVDIFESGFISFAGKLPGKLPLRANCQANCQANFVDKPPGKLLRSDLVRTRGTPSQRQAARRPYLFPSQRLKTFERCSCFLFERERGHSTSSTVLSWRLRRLLGLPAILALQGRDFLSLHTGGIVISKRYGHPPKMCFPYL